MADSRWPQSLMPYSARRSSRSKQGFPYASIALAGLILVVGLFSLPTLVHIDVQYEQNAQVAPYLVSANFPVSVDPPTKTITTNPQIEAILKQPPPSTLSAAAINAKAVLAWFASRIASLPLYAAVGGTDVRYVTIAPGFRQEQVAQAFGSELHWSLRDRQAFLKRSNTTPPQLTEGEFVPGTYEVSALTTPVQVQTLLYDRFSKDIISHYSSTTADRVPLADALNVAAIIEREAGGWDDMRDISGIIWNRLFAGMNLQVDATLQYARAGSSGNWWPQVSPKDKYVKSPYNTYTHPGLPPGPIANPSLAAVLAALNPKKTDCMYYFHDSQGNFHCSVTYGQHVALLKKYYGQGK